MQWLEAVKGSLGRTYNRRRAPRLMDPPVLAFYCAGAEAKPHQVRDISQTGVYVCTEERWYLGTMVQLTLDVKLKEGAESSSPKMAQPSITLWCKLVRHDDEGVGLDFVVVQKDRRDLLHKFLAGVKSQNL